VDLGVAGHLDVEVAPGLFADEGDEVARVLKLPANAVAARQVAAQGHQALHAHGLEFGELLAHRGARGADAREMACRIHALGQDLLHRTEGALVRGAARAVGDRAELRLAHVQLLARGAQLDRAFGRLGREEFETQRKAHLRLLRNRRSPWQRARRE
jgi:hypothetical protein